MADFLPTGTVMPKYRLEAAYYAKTETVRVQVLRQLTPLAEVADATVEIDCEGKVCAAHFWELIPNLQYINLTRAIVKYGPLVTHNEVVVIRPLRYDCWEITAVTSGQQIFLQGSEALDSFLGWSSARHIREYVDGATYWVGRDCVSGGTVTVDYSTVGAAWEL